MRPEPTLKPSHTKAATREGYITETREYELITPLFGGGVKTKEADPITVIRGSSIRGHLRFWWRATRLAQFRTLEDFRNGELNIWGGIGETTTVSQVSLEVETINPGNVRRSHELYQTQNGKLRSRAIGSIAPAYASFPLQPSDADLKEFQNPNSDKYQNENAIFANLRLGVRFCIRARFPTNIAEDVRAAFWAWETFGGIGGRTRRGFGALVCVKINGRLVPATDNATLMLRQGLEKHVLEHTLPRPDWTKNVPHLSRKLDSKIIKVIQRTPGFQYSKEAWDNLIEQYRSFRQFRPNGQRGISLWSEVDAIRRMNPGTRVHPERPGMPAKFPRARFGLPIIFHFKDRDDPQNPILELATSQRTRLASPVILRPLKLTNSYVGLALILLGNNVPDDDLVLDGVPVKRILTQAEADSVTRRQIVETANGNPEIANQVLNRQINILTAFMAFLKEPE
jgi:CRISPR-associated protein Cmr1